MEKARNQTERPMVKTSEYCTVGHPDRTCDYIASYLLDRYLEDDPSSRVALEVQLKDNFCTVSGEVTSRVNFTDRDISDFVRRALVNVGYTHGYQRLFGRENCISADDVHTVCHIGMQSSDIARGVYRGQGWGDQGIFFGYAVNSPETNYMPKDHYLARKLGNVLYDERIGGIDIKTQISMTGDEVTDCVVAIPLRKIGWKDDFERIPKYEGYGDVERITREIVGDDCPITINGTGEYIKHGSIGDCGTTGRKLVVDFYGGNCRIGGGSPWGKDPTKADVTLNMLARYLALKYVKDTGIDEVTCAISCCIGKPDITITYINGHGELISTEKASNKPDEVIDFLDLRDSNYADKCAFGLFDYIRIGGKEPEATQTKRESKSRRLQSLLNQSTYDYLKRSAVERGMSVNDRLNAIIEEESKRS